MCTTSSPWLTPKTLSSLSRVLTATGAAAAGGESTGSAIRSGYAQSVLFYLQQNH